jgi:hypothetical protein
VRQVIRDRRVIRDLRDLRAVLMAAAADLSVSFAAMRAARPVAPHLHFQIRATWTKTVQARQDRTSTPLCLCSFRSRAMPRRSRRMGCRSISDRCSSNRPTSLVQYSRQILRDPPLDLAKFVWVTSPCRQHLLQGRQRRIECRVRSRAYPRLQSPSPWRPSSASNPATHRRNPLAPRKRTNAARSRRLGHWETWPQ